MKRRGKSSKPKYEKRRRGKTKIRKFEEIWTSVERERVAERKGATEIDKSKIRVGGMVKKNSISINSNEVNFIITDFKNEINITYSGAVPNLFAEENGRPRVSVAAYFADGGAR